MHNLDVFLLHGGYNIEFLKDIKSEYEALVQGSNDQMTNENNQETNDAEIRKKV